MFKTFINIFRIPELRNKVLFTLFMLAIYRIGYHVPLPAVDQDKFIQKTTSGDTAGDRIKNYVALFSGGDLNSSTIFGLGIMPYISASIIFQLLTTVVPALEKLQKEGETGRKKIQEWTRYATVPMCLIQAVIWLSYMRNGHYVQSTFASSKPFFFTSLICLTAGCIFLMWLGEQIDEYGLGNGISLIILAGIVARMPTAISQLIYQSDMTVASSGEGKIGPGKILFLMAAFVFIVAGSAAIPKRASAAMAGISRRVAPDSRGRTRIVKSEPANRPAPSGA